VPVEYGDAVAGKLFGWRYVLTAAHCLPKLPSAYPASYPEERTSPALLGLWGAERTLRPSVSSSDPGTDIAVLAKPGPADVTAEVEAYEALTEAVIAFKASNPPLQCDATAPCFRPLTTTVGRTVSRG
jgi:hypothetical protein